MPDAGLGYGTIRYVTRMGRGRRNVYLRFRQDMTLEITIPRGSRVNAQRVMDERRDWIRRKYEELKSAPRILDDEWMMLGGMRFRIVFEPSGEEELKLDEGRGVVYLLAAERHRMRELLRRFYLRETSRYVVSKVSELEARLGVKSRGVDVREIKNWGYCTRGGRLSFNWQLAALPERLREYVVVHELVHLSEFNHSPRFRRVLASLCPDHRQRERELDSILMIRD